MKKLLTLIFLMFLSACGFEPLYVERTENSKWYFDGEFDGSISSEMQKVKVEYIADRFGQLLRNELIDILTPTGIPDEPRYKLYVVVVAETKERQALRRDITATREKVSYTIAYRMVENGEDIIKGDSIAHASYDIMSNPYSTTMAQKKAEADAAKIIANDISLRIGAYFHSQNRK